MLSDERHAELKLVLVRMREVSDRFYAGAVRTGCHPFIEFTGLINEYIKVCEGALEAGIDFTQANTHTGLALPVREHHAVYLAEKFDCIFGPTLAADPKARDIFWSRIGQGEANT